MFVLLCKHTNLVQKSLNYGSGIVPSLVDALQSVDIKIPNHLVISTEATDDHIDEKLYHLITLQTRVFVVHMLPALASWFFRWVQMVGVMSEGYVWIVTDIVADVLQTFDQM
jgi:glutamate receptor, ionotropic, plant